VLASKNRLVVSLIGHFFKYIGNPAN